MEKHSAAITAEKKQREALARQTEKQMRNQVGGTDAASCCLRLPHVAGKGRASGGRSPL